MVRNMEETKSENFSVTMDPSSFIKTMDKCIATGSIEFMNEYSQDLQSKALKMARKKLLKSNLLNELEGMTVEAKVKLLMAETVKVTNQKIEMPVAQQIEEIDEFENAFGGGAKSPERIIKTKMAAGKAAAKEKPAAKKGGGTKDPHPC